MGPLVLISDLHIASGPLDDCDAELQEHLVAFVEDLSRRPALELVINGDFLDFVQAEPWSGSELEASGDNDIALCFTEEQSIAKLESVHAAHKPIFDALSGFLKSNPEHRVTILPGNHDADFYFAGVRKRFADLVGKVDFYLDPVYRPAACPSVWIEHGHQSDPVNWFFWQRKPYWSSMEPPIFRDRRRVQRLLECPGTRFMLQFMNGVDRDYPFVDNVKPFSRFVRIFGASAFTSGKGSLKVAVALARMLTYLFSTVTHHTADVLHIQDETDRMAYDFLANRFSTLPAARLNTFLRRLSERGFAPEMPLGMYLDTPKKAEPLLSFLSAHPELLDEIDTSDTGLLGATVPGTLTLAKGFSVDETAELKKAANQALANRGVELVVMGHTHEPVEKSGKPYINTGCWTRYYQFGGKDDLTAWEVLRTDSYQTFPYELKYVEITLDRPAAAELSTFRDRHA